jgi:Alkylmercury lyase
MPPCLEQVLRLALAVVLSPPRRCRVVSDVAHVRVGPVGLLAQGQPATTARLADAAKRPQDEVAAQLERWPNGDSDSDGGVVAFSGLTLQTTPHSFEVDRRTLHTWCAWDTLFLPALLNTTAHVQSTCPVAGREVELVVAPDGVEHAEPAPLHVSFPPLATTDTGDITGSFCRHVHFLAGDDAARVERPLPGRHGPRPPGRVRAGTWNGRAARGSGRRRGVLLMATGIGVAELKRLLDAGAQLVEVLPRRRVRRGAPARRYQHPAQAARRNRGRTA